MCINSQFVMLSRENVTLSSSPSHYGFSHIFNSFFSWFFHFHPKKSNNNSDIWVTYVVWCTIMMSFLCVCRRQWTENDNYRIGIKRFIFIKSDGWLQFVNATTHYLLSFFFILVRNKTIFVNWSHRRGFSCIISSFCTTNFVSLNKFFVVPMTKWKCSITWKHTHTSMDWMKTKQQQKK